MIGRSGRAALAARVISLRHSPCFGAGSVRLDCCRAIVQVERPANRGRRCLTGTTRGEPGSKTRKTHFSGRRVVGVREPGLEISVQRDEPAGTTQSEVLVVANVSTLNLRDQLNNSNSTGQPAGINSAQVPARDPLVAIVNSVARCNTQLLLRCCDGDILRSKEGGKIQLCTTTSLEL